jgi:hypothetical protein
MACGWACGMAVAIDGAEGCGAAAGCCASATDITDRDITDSDTGDIDTSDAIVNAVSNLRIVLNITAPSPLGHEHLHMPGTLAVSR